MTDKSALLQQLRDRIAEDQTDLERRHQDIQAGATHEESRSEHAKDTRATEQSYLARGLAERVHELARTAKALGQLSARDFDNEEPIAVGALVEISGDTTSPRDDSECWLLVPGAGGIELEGEGVVIRTLTPVSPLGRALIGLSTGEEGEIQTPGGKRHFEVLRVA